MGIAMYLLVCPGSLVRSPACLYGVNRDDRKERDQEICLKHLELLDKSCSAWQEGSDEEPQPVIDVGNTCVLAPDHKLGVLGKCLRVDYREEML